MNKNRRITRIAALVFACLFLFPQLAAAAHLDVMAWYGDDRYTRFTNILREAAAAKMPGLTLEFMASAGRDKLITMVTGGALPDVVAVHTTDTFPQVAELNAFAPIRITNPELKAIPAELFAQWTRNGEILAIPAVVELSNMCINLTLLEQAGVAAPAWDWDWNDFFTIAKRLTRDDNGDGTPEVYGTSIWWTVEQMIVPWLNANGGSFMNSQYQGTQVTIDSEASIKAFEFLHSLIHESRVAFPGQGWNEWLQGKIGMNYMGSWSIGTARTRVAGAFSWDYIPYPKSPTTGRRVARISQVGLAVSASTKNLVDATNFVQLVGTRSVQEQFLQGGLSAVPARLDLTNSPYFHSPDVEPRSARRTIMDNLSGGYTVPDTVYPNPQMGTIAKKYVARILQSGDNPRIALTQAAQEMRAVMNQSK